mmetsp:Transcript_2211/g.6665  ORF Transcript_2211/g.6665 Transcript_2211/m.6665 type:complete len:381 (+) Transcript_2211:44-1186(+)
MGGSLGKAELALLDHGVRWWSDQGGAPVSYTTLDVPLHDGDGSHIHTVEYFSKGGEEKGAKRAPLVCLHGYGFGTGLYFSTMPSIVGRWGGRVFALDSLGCGLSSRPRWRLAQGESADVAEVEEFFVGGLERWRKSMKIDRMVLLGHSIGGYLAVAYAERYPQHVDRLILASPVGVPHPPAELAAAIGDAPFLVRTVLGMWRSGWSPMTLAKLGLGNMMMRGYVSRRFADVDWIPKDLLQAYLYQNWSGGRNSGGGYAHSTLLVPGGLGELAYARQPLVDRIPRLRVGRISAIYGEFDWMDHRNMKALKASLLKRKAEAGLEAPLIEVIRVASASHQIPIDNPLGFAEAVLDSCNDADAAHGTTVGGSRGAIGRLVPGYH